MTVNAPRILIPSIDSRHIGNSRVLVKEVRCFPAELRKYPLEKKDVDPRRATYIIL